MTVTHVAAHVIIGTKRGGECVSQQYDMPAFNTEFSHLARETGILYRLRE